MVLTTQKEKPFCGVPTLAYREPRRKCDKKKKRPRDRWENNQKMNKYFRDIWD